MARSWRRIPRRPGWTTRASARSGRAGQAAGFEVAAATDREAVAAVKTTTRTEGILPALETAHAVAALPRLLGGMVASAAAGPTRC